MTLENLAAIFLLPSMFTIYGSICIILWIGLFIQYFPKSNLTVLFELLYEKIYDFFIDILWKEEKKWIVMYVIGLFFIILILNFQWLVLEFLAPMIWMNSSWAFIIEHYVIAASADINFNIAMSIISILLIVAVQFDSLGIKDFFKSYFPILWKWYLEVERKNKHIVLYVLLAIPVKFFDIVISMFLWMLDLVGLLAKIISLSFRLFWNMTSGWVLLAMTIVMMSSITNDWFGFSFPIVIPVFIYMQEILIGLIQALVFSLLVAIFIKVARVG